MPRRKSAAPPSDMVGAKLGRRLITRFAGWHTDIHPSRAAGKRGSVWEYRCACGKVGTAELKNLRRNDSCGCVLGEVNRARLLVHGGAGTPEYGIYQKMVARCHATGDRSYHRYGGRGIRVCARWRESFAAFLADVGPRPSAKHSLDRIDNDGPYSPKNCRWATAAEQNRNKRNTRRLTHGGESLCLAEWARRLGVSDATLSRRLETRTVADALTMRKGGSRARANRPPELAIRRKPPRAPAWLKHGMEGTPEYVTWTSIKDRCYREKSPSFRDYGGRGIRVCDRWRNDFAAFFADMGKRPFPQHSLDRIDNNGDYSPGNCRWATRIEQASNTRRTRLLTVGGRTQTMQAWSRETGISPGTLHARLKAGWAAERAVATRPRRSNCLR